jgi:hypothetical protein
MADGTYKRIEFQLKRNLDAEATDPILGNVFYLKGEVMVGTAYVPVEISSNVAMNFMIRGDAVAKVEPGVTSALKIVFDQTVWFEGIDFANATVDSTANTIYVDYKNNHSILKAIIKNIKASAKVGKDKNNDGQIKSNEVGGTGEDTTDATTTAVAN